jgi:iron complex outermembrane receptor protein
LAGITQQGDGEIIKPIITFSTYKKGGWRVHASAEGIHRGGVNRTGEYQGRIFSDTARIEDNALATNIFDRRFMRVGSAGTDDFLGAFNLMRDERSEPFSITVFGNYNYRDGISHGFYRLPKDSTRVVASLYPSGFLPRINSTIQDMTGGIEFKFKFGREEGEGLNREKRNNIKTSATYGSNNFNIDISNSNNASLGSKSPTQVDAGTLKFNQLNANLDASLSILKPNVESKLLLYTGLFYRCENYIIEAAQDSTAWGDGNTRTLGKLQNEFGMQVFPGFKPEDAEDRRRNIRGYYGKLRWQVKNALIDLGARYESYEYINFKNLNSEDFSFKLAFSLKLDESIALRGSANQGFRAPSLHQYFYSKINTLLTGTPPVLKQAKNFDNQDTVVTNLFKIPSLKPEISNNFSTGVYFKLDGNGSISIDAYHIFIKDRIVLTGIYSSVQDSIRLNSVAKGISAAQFFTNAINTSTFGGDIIAAKVFELPGSGESSLDVRAGLNFGFTKVSTIRGASNREQNAIFNREEVGRIQSSQPNSKFIVQLLYNLNSYSISVRSTRFGEVAYIDPNVASQDQVFSSKWVTDINFSAQVSRLNIQLGINNLFNAYPDQHTNFANTFDGRFVYSRRVQQFGVAGRYPYLKIAFAVVK